MCLRSRTDDMVGEMEEDEVVQTQNVDAQPLADMMSNRDSDSDDDLGSLADIIDVDALFRH